MEDSEIRIQLEPHNHHGTEHTRHLAIEIHLQVQEEKLDLGQQLRDPVGFGDVFDALGASLQQRVGAAPQHRHQQETQNLP